MSAGEPYFSFFKSNAYPSIIVDSTNLEIRDANDAVRIFGYTPEELRGLHLSALLVHSDLLPDQPLKEARQWEIRTRDGQVLRLNAVFFPIHASSSTGICLATSAEAVNKDEVRRQFDVYLEFSARIDSARTMLEVGRAVEQGLRKTFQSISWISVWAYREDEDAFLPLDDESPFSDLDLLDLAARPDFRSLLATKQVRMFRNDVLPEPLASCESLRRMGNISLVPAEISRGPTITAVIAGDEPFPAGREEMRLLRTYVSQTAYKVERIRLLDDVRRTSNLLVELQEKERRAISQDVHDEIGGLLNALRLLLKMIRSEEPSIVTDLQEAVLLLDEVIAHVRDLSFRLSPTILFDLGLVPTLTSYTGRFRALTQIPVKFQNEVDLDTRFSVATESTIFRVVQESLTNASKYAGATLIQVHLREEGGSVIVHVTDDGVGFDPKALDRIHGGTGLRGLRERVSLAGGNLEIASTPGEGTRISAVLPK